MHTQIHGRYVGKLLAVAGLLFAAVVAAPPSNAAEYPDKPVRIVLPYPAGGGADVIGRPLGQHLSDRMGQRFVLDNRGGAGGNIAMELVAKSPADGYTLVLALTAQLAVNQSLYREVPFDALKDYEPVSLLASAPYFLAVHPSVPARTVEEFIKLARANPGKLTFGSSGNGGGPHLSMELFKSMAKVDLLHVPYRGAGPALPNLIGGQVDAMFVSYGTAAANIRAGNIRVLAVTTPRRSAAMPDVPTMSEAGLPGYDSGVWYALLAPRGTPKAIVNKLNSEVNALLSGSELRNRLLTDGLTPIGSTPNELSNYMKSERSKWTSVVKNAGVRID